MNLNKENKKQLLKNILIALIGVASVICIGPEIVSADSKFDINAAATASTAPFNGALQEHWGKFVLLTAGASGLFGEGDGIQRAKRAVAGATIGGGAILGLIALLA